MAEWLRRQPAKLMGFARVGSNPTVVVSFFGGITTCGEAVGGVAHSVERSVRNRQAQGSKPCSSILLLRFSGPMASANGVSVTLKLPKL
jgi:hypothetical protein